MSNVLRIIFKNTFWLTLAEGINGVLLFFLTVWLARYFGADFYGKLMFAMSLTALFAIFFDLGLSTLSTREIARNREKSHKYISNILVIKIILSIITLILIVSTVQFLNKEPVVIKLIYLLSFWTIFISFSSFFQSIFRAYEKMQYEALVKVSYVMVLFILGIFLIWQKLDIIMLGWFYIISAITSLIIAVLLIRKKFARFNFDFDFSFWKTLLSKSWPFALSAVFIMIYYYMDSVMLGIMGQDREVGWYNAAYRPIMFLIMISGLVSAAFFPAISRLYKESLVKLKELLSQYSKLILFLSIPMAFGGTFLAPELIELIFGYEYLNSILAFQILIWTAAIIYISSIYAPTLQACDRQKIHLLGVGLGAIINIILNFILIPAFSLYGAAIATLFSELIVVIYMITQLKKVISIEFIEHLSRPLLASVLMLVALILLESWNVIILIFVGFAVYILSMLLIGGIKKRDIAFFKGLFINKKP